MYKVNIIEVNVLRDYSDCTLMDCKRALIASDGDMVKALAALRKPHNKLASTVTLESRVETLEIRVKTLEQKVQQLTEQIKNAI